MSEEEEFEEVEDEEMLEENDEEMEFLDEQKESEEEINNAPLILNLEKKELSFKDNPLYNEIDQEISKIDIYLEESVNNFHKLFNDQNLNSFNDIISYLENISNKNKCVCAALIKNVPAWRCVDCCKYESAIYCSDCYKKSKDLHKNHKIYYLYASGGICDCGDPDSLSTFCPDHSGPYTNQVEIDKYISTIFDEKVINKLKIFFDEFFWKFSKLLIMVEKCDLFCQKKYDEIFNKNSDEISETLIKERQYVGYLKRNFCKLFQKLVNFFRLISNKNLGMLNILANYFLKNNFNQEKETNEDEDKYKTSHTCIEIFENDILIHKNAKMEIEKDKIEINNSNKDIEKHRCKCSFLRLLLLNWTDDIKQKYKENSEFILSFPRNIPLKRSFCILYLYDYKQFILNNSISILENKSQFFSEEITVNIAQKTTIIEDSFEVFYNYFSKEIKRIKNLKYYFDDYSVKELCLQVIHKQDDIEYFTKPNIRELMGNKISIIKRIIDCICLVHNEIEFKSIVPHPEFQDKGFSNNFIDLEQKLLDTIEKLNILIKWEKIEYAKEIFEYIINKIIYQEKEGIKQLKENEYSFHLTLYRCFGLIMNYFCFYYSFNNNCSITESINFCKKNFFNSEKDMNKLVNLILNDYLKLFGFIGGTKNGFFNYYNNTEYYFILYLHMKEMINADFTLLKYIFNLYDDNFTIKTLFQKSNIENVYSSFEEMFLNNKNSMIIEEESLNPYKNIINQWKFLLELIITFMKDDISPFLSYINQYENIISSKTKKDLFEIIRNNKKIMEDLENILKEQIIHGILGHENLIDYEKINKHVNDYLLTLFGEKRFKEILNELTLRQTNNEKILFFLKDCNLKYLDMNYYISPKEKSKAQKYILDFKKDTIKVYNNYYFNPSEITFNFFENAYKKILLNEENLELIISVIEKLLISSDSNSKNINLVKNIFFPSILNYLSVFGCINTESFIEFKKNKSNLINQLCNVLVNSLDKNNKKIDNDSQEYIKEIIQQVKRYEIIYKNIINNNIKLKNYDYNTNNNELLIDQELSKNEILIDNNNKIINEKNLKSKSIKDNLKKLMKAKTEKFMDKANLNENILKLINDKNEQNIINPKDETMCFFCRNNIELKSFNKPYGKAGNLVNDYFYYNAIKSSVKNELYRLNENIYDDNLYEQIIENDIFNDKNYRMLSCGHYFHVSCFKEHYFEHLSHEFNCPLCLKKLNILIPPLNFFQNKYSVLMPEKMSKLLNKKNKIKKFENSQGLKLFNEIILNYLKNQITINIKIDKKISEKDFDLLLEDILWNYRSSINFLENIFYIEGTNFNKQQQIDNIKNYILSLRFLVKTNIIDINLIVDKIKDMLSKLVKGPAKLERIFFNYENIIYNQNIDKLFLLISILFNYNEIKDTFIYIINFFLPYFCFGFYLRNLIAKNKYFSLDKKKKQKLNMKNLEEYLSKNNQYLVKNCLNYFIQKLLIIKIITDYENGNDEIINNFNKLPIEKMFNLIEQDKLYNSIKKKNKSDIKIMDILKNSSKLFKKEDCFYKYGISFNYKIIFESLINNIKKTNNDIYLIKKELIIQFQPIKFNFINLENNIFDFVEKYLYKKCIICYNNSKYYYICLICGNKVCHTKNCRDYSKHIKECTGSYCIFIDMDDMQIFLCSEYKEKKIYPLYVNEAGVGPNEREIGNEFNLSHENLQITLKKFICNDFNF